MRHYTYVPLVIFFILISIASKTFATPITDLQDIVDWLSITFIESGFNGSPDQYTGFNSEVWGNGPSAPVTILPPGSKEPRHLFTNTLVKPSYDTDPAVQPILTQYTGGMTIPYSFAAGEPSALGIQQDVSTPGRSGLLSKIVPVPEPGTMLLFGTGLLGLASLRGRRKG